MAVEIQNTETPQKIFDQHGGVVRTKQLLAAGVSYYQLQELLSTGAVVKLKRGLYRWADTPVSELAEVAQMVKKGVFCLFSAAFHHGLTTFVSAEYHLAVPKKYKVVLPEYPPIKCYYWNEAAYLTGVTKVEIEGSMVPMYDVEKTVCDLFRYRKKVGMDTLKEVLKNYVGRPDRNLNLLSKYAAALRIEKEVNQYITLLL